MAKKTLCDIKDIKGWKNYNKCPYTKSLYSKAGVSDVLHNSVRKEKFFKTLQKNVGRDGYLTNDAMKKTLGEFKNELDQNQFYKLAAAVLPNEKQRYSLGRSGVSENKSGPSNISGGGVGSKKETVSGKTVQPNIAKFIPAGLKAGILGSQNSSSFPSKVSPEVETESESLAKQPLGLAASIGVMKMRDIMSGRGKEAELGSARKGMSFSDALSATMKNKNKR